MGWGDRKRIEAKQLGNAHIRCVSGQAGRYSAFEQIISLGHSIHRRALDLRFRNNPSRQFKRPAPLATCTAWYSCEELVRSVQGTPFKSMKGRNRISIDDTECGAETTLTVDSYARCNRVLDLRDNAPIQLAYCWAHARRKLFDLTHHNVAPIAEEGLKQIAALYRIEKQTRRISAEDRRALRQAKSAPKILDFKTWLDHARTQVSAKSPTGDALKYIAKYLNGLILFLTDGRIEMDRSAVERTIRPNALQRKNALLAGHDAGAQNRAMLASLIET